MKNQNLLLIIGGGVRREPGCIDDITGTQSEARALVAARTIDLEPDRFSHVCLSGGIACGGPYQTLPESLLMTSLLLEELTLTYTELSIERFEVDSWALNSVQNIVHSLSLFGNRHHMNTCRHSYCTAILPNFQLCTAAQLREHTAEALAEVASLTFVTFAEHFERLVYIIRHGLQIGCDLLPEINLIDTGRPSDTIIQANQKSMEAALIDPLGIGQESLARLAERQARAKQIEYSQCWKKEFLTQHRMYLDQLEANP